VTPASPPVVTCTCRGGGWPHPRGAAGCRHATAVPRPPTRALLRAVCGRLGLDPALVCRISLLPDRVVVDRLVRSDSGQLLELTETLGVPW
jgi:hypothetical protein